MRPTDKLLRVVTGSRWLPGSTRVTRVVSVTAIFFAVCAVGAAAVAPLAPDASDLPVKKITQTLPLPVLDEQIAALEASEQHFIREETIRRGDTLSALLLRLGVDDDEADKFIKSDSIARNLLQLRTDKAVRARTNEEGELEWLQMTLQDGSDKPARNIEINRDANGHFVATEVNAKLERRVEMASGNIRSSLFAATDEANISDPVASQIVSMFETNIDFRKLQRGDQFNVVYESFWQNGQLVKTGRVLAGEFTNAGKTYQSVWFDEAGGQGGYYTFDGKSLKKAFLKSPLKFTRISSGFSMRMHPILGVWKAHQGVDFAAPTGTPIRASGDGVVEMAGKSNGYGNLIVIKHWGAYSTAYGHMSAFAPGIHKGSHVSQGDVIGYVGSTGWATGPHLHYEFRVSNQPKDPMSIVVPDAPPLAGNDMPRFKAIAADMTHRFNLMRPERFAETMKLASR
ncbi:M23 family metallopeptidase [Undibacterium oligocarboniphilum]|uniref:Peptidoglycan DD-metalloendopeptidase family protein n=1 Tax=Undibacterium oligocarboniphilum TaxID=666702 RepID=A0A850QMJ5_9BURK|nr:peptidoglycan DD-metalloendopeptidase family protein [Undibacterium oligocarboniphilum]MBC3869987.1 peptidoglycan DD-metalloendopeptidase family protein [Undibacterium oligocarboniphilum]NVO77604.1 peptidoglycan DD-metalloendopeptidase family protein [Undibacterium oligocarboniphilum]